MDLHLLTNQSHFGAWLYDNHLVTCDLKRRHLGIHNPSAAVLWGLLEEAVSIDLLVQDYAEIFSISVKQARQDVESCLRTWKADGWACQNEHGHWLIAPEIGKMDEPRMSNGCNNVTGFNPIADLSSTVGLHCKIYSFGDVPFELLIKSTAPIEKDSFSFNFCQRLISVCDGFRQFSFARASNDLRNPNPPNHASKTAWVTLTFDGLNILLQDSYDLNARFVSSELAMGHVYESLIRISYPKRQVVLSLHAAGVKKNHQCFALAGVSGVGKSTLSAFLAHSGWYLLGDDIVAIELHQSSKPSLGLLPFPTAVGLKSGSWPALAPLYPELEHLPVLPYGEKLAKYLAIKAMHDQFAPSAPSFWDAIVLPQYKSNIENSNKKRAMKPLTPAEGLRGLLTAGMSLFGAPTVAEIDRTLNALIGLPCFSIEYSNFDEALACLNDLTRN
jgi:hypothetical protein